MTSNIDTSLPTEEDVILLLGNVVYEAQETEATIHLLMSVIFGLTEAQSIEHLSKVYAKKTLGQFLVLVREKIGLKESFDEYMEDYIQQRNFIIHNISRTKSFSLYTEQGRRKSTDFLTSFRYKNRKVKLTFMALTEMWMGKISSEFKSAPELEEFRSSELFREIEREFIPKLSTMFERISIKSTA